MKQSIFALSLLSLNVFSDALTVDSTYSSAMDGAWSTPSNWTSNPLYPNDGNGGANFNATVGNGPTVTLDQDIEIEDFRLLNATIIGDYDLTLKGNLVWGTGMADGTGTIRGTGITSVAGPNSVIALGTKILGRTLTNTGTMTFQYSGNSTINVPFYFGASGAESGLFNNVGTFNFGGGGIFSENIPDPRNAINNSGTWNTSGVASTNYIGQRIAFNNTGGVHVQSGDFTIMGGGTSTGSFDVPASSILSFANYTWGGGTTITGAGRAKTLSGAANITAGITNTDIVNVAALEFAGGAVLGAGTLNIASLQWDGGLMSGTGTTNLTGDNSSAGEGTQILARTLNNTGTMTYGKSDGGNGNLWVFGASGNAGVLNNSGTFSIISGGDFAENYVDARNAINNSGAWNVSGVGANSIVGQRVSFNNTGNVQVQSGTMTLFGGGTSSGNFQVEAGAVLDLNLGEFTWNSVHATGSGIVSFSGGTVTLNGLYTSTAETDLQGGTVNANAPTMLGAFTLSSGILTGTGAVSSNGFTWSGGTMSGSGVTNISGAGTVSNTGTKILARTLNNSGVMSYTGSDGEIWKFDSGSANGIFNNSGTFNMLSGGQFVENSPLLGNEVNNSGTWNLDGAGMQGVIGTRIAFSNSGVVNVQGGTFVLLGGFSQTAGALNLVGGDVSSNSAMNFVGGSLQGSGSIAGDVTNGANIAPGFSVGRIGITGDLTLTDSSSLQFEIGGNTPGVSYDLLTEAGGLILSLRGTLSLSVINGYDPTGLTFTILSSNQNLGAGSFANVAPGERLLTSDGLGSFQVIYGTSSPDLVLANYATIPEPATAALLIGGFAFGMGCSRCLLRLSAK